MTSPDSSDDSTTVKNNERPAAPQAASPGDHNEAPNGEAGPSNDSATDSGNPQGTQPNYGVDPDGLTENSRA
ncbi:hypothetical protein [Corynebacterium heidelbergense]|uniref:Uncharacterized protein n=1 Tax=Corynebacterium heidelbergense TaxID=2055947 RepID=A0A364VBP5_9CORY|nr:hypothetical protein [Corynebacterium heidelbergense]RAV33986.1 hypothetical protein CWC39_05585 [Corynebacterium heidelbergense]WCZ37140.1 hypothetical protein CHEID_08045 [Corynebacterium heidelbergense]